MSRSYRIFECKGCKKIFIKSIDHTLHIAQCDDYKAKFPSSTNTAGISSTTHSQRSSAATVKPQSGTKREVITLSDSDEETTVVDKQKTASRSAQAGQCVIVSLSHALSYAGHCSMQKLIRMLKLSQQCSLCCVAFSSGKWLSLAFSV